MKRLILLFALAALVAPVAAEAHLATKPKGKTVAARAASQKENLAHARYVCRRGANETRRWHCAAVKWLEREYAETLRALRPPSPQQVICAVFSRVGQCREAVTVASCETGGTFWPGARNGQFLGVFQMGTSERARFGHGPTVRMQAEAALRYWLVAGWRPWQCLPYGGLRW